MKIVGIIGGFGPEATANFQLKIVELCRARNHSSRPPLLIWNTPIPLKIEENLLLKSRGTQKFLPFLIDAAQRLEKAEADFLVLPCNTLHIFIDAIKKSVNIPVISIVEETATFLKSRGISKVGVFATSITIKSRIHSNELFKVNIKPFLPSQSDQEKIDQMINDINNNHLAKNTDAILRQISNKFLLNGVNHFLLACTDLHIIFRKLPRDMFMTHDTLHILAEATVREIFTEGR